jgi:hypothetical protein
LLLASLFRLVVVSPLGLAILSLIASLLATSLLAAPVPVAAAVPVLLLAALGALLSLLPALLTLLIAHGFLLVVVSDSTPFGDRAAGRGLCMRRAKARPPGLGWPASCFSGSCEGRRWQ